MIEVSPISHERCVCGSGAREADARAYLMAANNKTYHLRLQFLLHCIRRTDATAQFYLPKIIWTVVNGIGSVCHPILKRAEEKINQAMFLSVISLWLWTSTVSTNLILFIVLQFICRLPLHLSIESDCFCFATVVLLSYRYRLEAMNKNNLNSPGQCYTVVIFLWCLLPLENLLQERNVAFETFVKNRVALYWQD